MTEREDRIATVDRKISCLQTRVEATVAADSVYATKNFLHRDFQLICRSLNKVIHEGASAVLRPSMTSR